MTEENVKKFEKLYHESDGTSSWLEILQDNFTFEEVFGRKAVLSTDGEVSCFGVQKLDSPTGKIFKLNLNLN